MGGGLTNRKGAAIFAVSPLPSMTGFVSALLSIAILAAFALIAGGAWLVLKRGERKQGGLMILAALVLLANVLIWTV